MNAEQAQAAVDSWYELTERDERFRDSYHVVNRLLRQALPTDTSAAAGASVDGSPGIVAIAGNGLFLLTLARPDGDEDDQALEPVIERLPLAPIQPTLRIREGWREERHGSLGGVTAQVREWKLTWPDGRVVVFESVIRRSGGWHDGPDQADAAGRALAEVLGWTLPA